MAPRHVFGPFVHDPGRGLLRDGEPVAVGHRGIALLGALLEADGQPVAKAMLFELAWPRTIVEEVNLSVQIAALRKALGQDAEGREWITTVPRRGTGFRTLRVVLAYDSVSASKPRKLGDATSYGVCLGIPNDSKNFTFPSWQ